MRTGAGINKGEKKSGQIDYSKSWFSVTQHQQDKPVNSVIKIKREAALGGRCPPILLRGKVLSAGWGCPYFSFLLLRPLVSAPHTGDVLQTFLDDKLQHPCWPFINRLCTWKDHNKKPNVCLFTGSKLILSFWVLREDVKRIPGDSRGTSYGTSSTCDLQRAGGASEINSSVVPQQFR